MKKKVFSILSALLIAVLVTSTAGAGAIKLTKVSLSLSTSSGGTTASALRSTESVPSLVATGFAIGLGNMVVNVKLDASGDAETVCTNNGENDVPGQSYPKVSAIGTQTLSGDDATDKNGKSPFKAGTVNPTTVEWDEAGCPNSNWTAQIAFIKWTKAKISVQDANGTDLIEPLQYNCVTKKIPLSVKCDPAN